MSVFSNFVSKLKGSTAPKQTSAFKEAGVSSTAIMGGVIYDRERNPSLRGTRKYATFEDNLANLAIVSASIRFYTTLIASSEWSVDPFDDSPEAEALAETMDMIINDSQHSFVDMVKAASLFKFNGFAILEMTAQKRDDGIIGIHSVESRPCRTISKWDVDDNGNIRGVWQEKPLTSEEVFIPRNKYIYLVDNLQSDSPEGFGYFRAIAESCSRLKEYQIDEKIAFDRDLRGIPIGRVPFAALNDALKSGQIDKKTFDSAVSGVTDFVTMQKKGERTAIVLDSATYQNETQNMSGGGTSNSSTYQYGVDILNSQTSGLPDIDKVIRRLNGEIARIMGTEVLLVGEGTTGSLALSKDKSQNLMLTINSALGEIATTLNKDLVPFIAKLNGWDMKRLPILTPSEISQRSVEEIASTVRDLASAGVTLARGDEAVNEMFNMIGITPPEANEVDVL